MAAIKHRLSLSPATNTSPRKSDDGNSKDLPLAAHAKVNPNVAPGNENASIYFVGTATTILEWEGIRLMTDPNFLHAGDHVHLGPGVTGTRLTNPAVDLEQLPRIDVVLLSHYHADHFDQKVEAELRRDLPIVTTPHAKSHLQEKKSEQEKFTEIYDLDFHESALLSIPPDTSKTASGSAETRTPAIKVAGMPGKHVPPGPLSVANDVLAAVPPTNGWMLELGYKSPGTGSDSSFENGYRIYISGDTLMIDELKEIPQRYLQNGEKVDLMLVHLGGTTIPGPKMPLLMVTMDAKQGIELMRMIQPDMTVPIHYDDYDVFLSPLQDFKKAVEAEGWSDRVAYLDRGDQYEFSVAGKL